MAKSNLTAAGALYRDGHNSAVQVAGTFTTRDVTGTPLASPLAYSTTEIPLLVPEEAIRVLLYASTALRVSEVTGMARYFVLPATTLWRLDVARMTTVFVKRDSADGTLQFMFEHV